MKNEDTAIILPVQILEKLRSDVVAIPLFFIAYLISFTLQVFNDSLVDLI